MSPKQAAAHRKRGRDLVDRHGRLYPGDAGYKKRRDDLPEHREPEAFVSPQKLPADLSRYVGMWVAYDGAVVHASSADHADFLVKVRALPARIRERVTSFMVTEETKVAIS